MTRGAVAAEGVEGGFSAVYRILSAFEDSGQARRGYVVEGLGAAQFAMDGAVDRLRAAANARDRGEALPQPSAYGAPGGFPGRLPPAPFGSPHAFSAPGDHTADTDPPHGLALHPPHDPGTIPAPSTGPPPSNRRTAPP